MRYILDDFRLNSTIQKKPADITLFHVYNFFMLSDVNVFNHLLVIMSEINKLIFQF